VRIIVDDCSRDEIKNQIQEFRKKNLGVITEDEEVTNASFMTAFRLTG